MYIFVITTKDNKIVVGEASNPAKAISEYNTEYHKQLDRIIGYKRKNKTRTVESVVEKFRHQGKDVSIYRTKRQRWLQHSSRQFDKRIKAAVAKDRY